MAGTYETKSYIGVGKVFVRAYGTTGMRRHVGNVSRLDLTHALDTQRQRDYTQSGGGTEIRIDRLESVEAAMTWLTFSKENWAIATQGTATAVVSGTVGTPGETVKLHKGGLAVLTHPPTAITSVTDNSGTTTYDVGDDYEMTAGGLFIPSSSGITDAADHKVIYTYGAYTRIEGAMGTSQELEVFFEGLNEADSDKPMLVDLWRMSMPAAETISLIGAELGEMSFASELLKDSNKGSGVSSFYRARMVT
jgi:hypothetical protein